MKQKVCAIISCIIVGFVTCTMLGTVLMRKITGGNVAQVKEYTGKEDYPFYDNESNASSDAQQDNLFIKVLKVFGTIKENSEKITSDEYPYKMPFVVTKKTWDKYTGIDMTTSFSTDFEWDTVVDIGDGHLSYIVNDFDVRYIESQIEFGKQMEEKGINFLLFMNPFKLDENSDIKSGVYVNRSYEFEQLNLEMFREAGLNVISTSEIIKEQGLDRHNMFFKTDHHWLPQTALWANKIMCEYLNENFGFSIDTDIFSEENYDIIYAEEKWLGTLGKKVTAVYCEPEPFPIIIPKYETDVTAFISLINETKTGAVEDVLLDWEVLKKDLYDRRSYDMYGYGNTALLSIHNNKVKDGRRVLLVKRSFADAMIPYFAATVENLDVIDLRVFKGSLQTYIDKTKPDTVIMIYGITEITDDSAYDFR